MVRRLPCFNNRLQVTGIRLGAAASSNCTNPGNTDLLNLGYTYPASPNNNGNVASQMIQRQNQSWVENYTNYDGVNRLKAANEAGGWGQTFDYDAYGNRVVLSGVVNGHATPTGLGQYLKAGDPRTKNRWYGTGADYDAAGNQIALSSRTYKYDAENRVIYSTQPNINPVGYWYDGDGRRVMKVDCPATSLCMAGDSGASVTVYVYDAQGQLAAEYGVAGAGNGTRYVTGDALGSTRLLTDANHAAVKCYDYYPFGEDIASGTNGRSGTCFGDGGYPAVGPDAATQKFTSKERDWETGLDYFGARYFSGAQGRFTSPDPMIITGTRLLDPQGLNLYSYTRNRPTIAVDDGGLGTVVVTVGAGQSANVFYAGNGSSRSYAGLARGQGRDRLQGNADTPFGKYTVTGYDHGRLGPAYGRAKIRMEPVAGQNEALKAHPPRANLRIHGGGSNRRLVPDPYADHQPLISTYGCVRMANADVEDLWGALDDEDEDEVDSVYVGTRQSLQIMSLTSPDLRYALRRQEWLSQLFFNALFQSAPSKPDPEPDRQPPHPRKLIPRGPDEQ